RSLEGVHPGADYVKLRISGEEAQADFAVMALPFQAIGSVLPQDNAGETLRSKLAHFESSSITGIHFWFDRQITDLDHAVLLDRTIQWMFHKSRIQNREASTTSGSYVELVVSASQALLEKPRNEILDLALAELRE